MEFIKANLKKDRSLILKNSVFLAIILVFSLQIYGVFWFEEQYKNDDRLKNGGIYLEFKDISKKEIDDILSVKNIEDVNMSYHMDKNKFEVENVDFNKLESMFHETKKVILLNLEKVNRVAYLGKYVDYSDEDNVVSVPHYVFEYYKYKLGDKIIINGQEFIIKGVTGLELGARFIVSVSGAKRIGLGNLSLSLDLNDALGRSEIDQVKTDVLGVVNKENANLIESPPLRDANDTILPMLLVVFILSIFNIILVYNYSLEKRRVRRSIYRIEGLNNKRMFLHSTVELVVIFLFGACIASLYVEIFNNFIMKVLFKINRYTLSLSNYLFLFGIYFVIYILLATFNNRKLFKENILLK